jgi:16S rRNA (cytidine1402-2'-O)-methyltransferase
MQARQKEIGKFSNVDASLIYYESPKRLLNCLKDISTVLGDREVAVCRELTKLYEEVRKDNIEALIEYYDGKPTPKGEIVIVVSPPNKNEGLIDDLDAALIDALKTLSVKEAVAAVTFMSGKKRREVYKRALALLKNDEG